MSMYLRGVLLHLCEYVSDDSFLSVLGDVQELWPREYVIKVVFHLVVFWEASEVALLHLEEVVERGDSNGDHRGFARLETFAPESPSLDSPLQSLRCSSYVIRCFDEPELPGASAPLRASQDAPCATARHVSSSPTIQQHPPSTKVSQTNHTPPTSHRYPPE